MILLPQAERKKQAELVLEPFANLSTGSKNYDSLFHQVAGFFLVEDNVLNTTQNLLTKQWVHDLWDAAVVEIARVIQIQMAKCRSAVVIVDVKKQIVLFSQTLQTFGYNCTRLFETLLRPGGGRDRYNEAMLQQCGLQFEKLFATDNGEPMVVNTDQEFVGVTSRYPFDKYAKSMESKALGEMPFPREFPFSSAVPSIYGVIRKFVRCLRPPIFRRLNPRCLLYAVVSLPRCRSAIHVP